MSIPLQWKELTGIVLLLLSTSLLVSSLVLNSWFIDNNSKAYSFEIGLLSYALDYYGELRYYKLPDNAGHMWQSYLGNVHTYYTTGIYLFTTTIISLILNTLTLVLIVVQYIYQQTRNRQLYNKLKENNKSYNTSSSDSSNNSSSDFDNVTLLNNNNKLSGDSKRVKLYVVTPVWLSGLLITLSIIIYEFVRPSFKGDIVYGISYLLYVIAGMTAQISSFFIWWQSTRYNEQKQTNTVV